MQITKDTIIGELIDIDPGTAKFLFEIGMHCLGCPAARSETIAQACEVHGADADAILSMVNLYLSKKKYEIRQKKIWIKPESFVVCYGRITVYAYSCPS